MAVDLHGTRLGKGAGCYDKALARVPADRWRCVLLFDDEVGRDVTSVQEGDRVSGEGHIVCGTCRNCRAGRRHLCINTIGVGVNRDGALADHVVIPATNVWVHHDDIDPDLGAVFDPLGNAVHTALKFPLAAEDVLVTGSGPRPERTSVAAEPSSDSAMMPPRMAT